jgi:hypothetical protein
MKNYVKLFEDFSGDDTKQSGFRCDPIKILDMFDDYGGVSDDLRMAAYLINDFGVSNAERESEDPGEVMAIRRLAACSSSSGVDVIGMLDLLEDWRMKTDKLREMLFLMKTPSGERRVRSMDGGIDLITRLNQIH